MRTPDYSHRYPNRLPEYVRVQCEDGPRWCPVYGWRNQWPTVHTPDGKGHEYAPSTLIRAADQDRTLSRPQ